MKKFSMGGVSLNFVEKNADKENAILFLHGNSHSLRTFHKQMSSDLLKDYRLISVDLPGHGDSSPSEDYSLIFMATLIKGLTIELGLKSLVIVGYSMGGHVAINTLAAHLNPQGLFLFGTPPVNKPFDPTIFLPNPKTAALQKTDANYEEISTFMDELNYKSKDKEIAIADYLRTDPQFRIGVLGTILKGEHQNEIILIKNYGGPAIILLATKETLVNNDYTRAVLADSNVQLVDIEAGHSPHTEVSEKFNGILADFCKSAFKVLIQTPIHESNYGQHERK